MEVIWTVFDIVAVMGEEWKKGEEQKLKEGYSVGGG